MIYESILIVALLQIFFAFFNLQYSIQCTKDFINLFYHKWKKRIYFWSINMKRYNYTSNIKSQEYYLFDKSYEIRTLLIPQNYLWYTIFLRCKINLKVYVPKRRTGNCFHFFVFKNRLSASWLLPNINELDLQNLHRYNLMHKISSSSTQTSHNLFSHLSHAEDCNQMLRGR